MKPAVLLGTLLLILGAVNGFILAKERILDEGASILLPLASVSPRFPLQGNYLSLEYHLERRLPAAALDSSGHLVLALDGGGVASFRRLHRGEALLSDEQLLFYRKRGGLRLGAESFSLGLAKAEECAGARFAELKVDREGRSVLVGLRNSELRRVCW